jgi:hypothetical protein
MRIGSAESPGAIAGYVLFGLVFGVAGFYIFRESPIAGCVFGGLGALMLFGAVHAWLSRQRYGDVALDVGEPVVPGGRLMAKLLCPGGGGGATKIHVELRCKKVEYVRAAGKRSLGETILWSAKADFPLERYGDAARCAIAFDMPADAPLSDAGLTRSNVNTQPGIYWEVHAASEDVPGVDLMRAFRFPVVAGAPPSSDLMRARVTPVSTPEKTARSELVKQRYLEASKAPVYAIVIGGAALFAYMYFGQPSGRAMSRAFFAVIAAAMLAYWIASYRNWLRDKVDNPDTPPLTGMFLWHGIVLAIAGWQLL